MEVAPLFLRFSSDATDNSLNFRIVEVDRVHFFQNLFPEWQTENQ